MKIYTKIGDQGETRLGDGQKVAKTDTRLVAYGGLDELNAALGLALGMLRDCKDEQIALTLQQVQNKLFALGSLLANPKMLSAVCRGEKPGGGMDKAALDDTDVQALEGAIDRVAALLPPLKTFILPGGSLAACQLHVARTVCRRAERSLAAFGQSVELPVSFIPYVNRLSDLLFMLARYANHLEGIEETPW